MFFKKNHEAIFRIYSQQVNFNYLCVDNIENRKIIQDDPTLDIKLVPCLLIVNSESNRITKYEGQKCHDYLLQYQKQQTPIPEPQPISQAPPPIPIPSVQQQQQPPPPKQQLPQVKQEQQKHQKQQQEQQKQQKQQQQQQHIMLGDEDESFNNLPDTNQVSSIILSENEDEDEEQQQPVYNPPPLPVIPQKQLNNKGKPSLLAQATAMQKSRLMEEEANKKK